MTSHNITRAQAQQRSQLIATKSYNVLVDLSGRSIDGSPLADPQTTFIAHSIVDFTANDIADSQNTWIDVIAEQVLEAQLDDVVLPADAVEDARINFTATPGDHKLKVVSLMRFSRTGEGLHRFVDPADGTVTLYTQFESADARRMYANFEQPDLKASFSLSVIAPSDWQVFSNSITPKPSDLGEGFALWDFAPTAPISTYLTALVCGEYFVNNGTITSVKGELPAAVVCRHSMAEYLDADRIRQTAQRGFEVYEQAFGHEYAFDKYDQIFVPEFNFGAMENAGCVTFRDQYIFRSKASIDRYDTRDNTILHELAHMWFGDLVTMKWWNDIWLNESFAEWSAYYCQQKISEKFGGRDAWVTFANARKAWAYTADQLPSTHPIANEMVDLDAVDQNFDGITYAKGASVLKQLVSYVGEDNFLAGVRAYFQEFQWKNTVFDDLLNALQKASGRDLSHFASQWLETAGVNTVTPQIKVDEDGVVTSFNIVQSAPEKYPTLRSHTLAIGQYSLQDGKLVSTGVLPVDISGANTQIAALEGSPRPDVFLLNDKDLSYTKVRLDDASLHIAAQHLADMPDAMGRVIVWTSLNDMLQDAEMPTGQYLNIVLAGLTGETDDTAVRHQISMAKSAALSYAAPANRVAYKTQLVAGLTEHLMHSKPGSDRQLAFADALISSIDSPAGAELLKGWLRGEDVPEGLDIDSDRRWLIITSLARLGQISATEIDAEYRKDSTISGAQAAAGARAALADADSKLLSWKLLTKSPDLPNHTYSEIAANFFNYGQEELTQPYVEKYLQIVDQICSNDPLWQKRGHRIRQTALTSLWPAPLIDSQWLDDLEVWMANHEVSDQAERILKERISLSRRALKARELDAATSQDA